ncbi:hypothetical protein ACFOY8_07085 [Thalassospira xianhensis]|uniref:Uncharacterized protein n=1 Tax=Thalassospira xianhensis MCCC 1A02616 TaxID=1177929 RepID=A0A367UE71_9PROT|nr:hypothetical protein [Thalassospira xianhensis]RCK06616.1 hypothetical protein TH5_07360 [Thalassospira xianhensis MCCC 1A02616]
MFSEIIAQAAELKNAADQMITALQDATANDGSQLISGDIVFGEQTLGDVYSNITSVVELSSSLPAKASGPPFPRRSIGAVVTNLQSAVTECTNIVSDVSWVKQQGFTSVDENVAIMRTANGQNRDLRGRFQNIVKYLEATTEHLLLLKLAFGGQSENPFSGLRHSIKKMLAELDEAKREVSSIKRVAKGEATKASTSSIGAASALAEVQKAHAELSGILTDWQSKSDEVENLLQRVRTNEQQATELGGRISAFDPDFEGFKLNLREVQDTLVAEKEAVEKFLEDNRSELESLVKNAMEVRKEHEEIDEQSRKLLGLATSAGLANSYAAARKNLDGPISVVRWEFYGSIIFLFVSVLCVFNALPFVNGYIQFPSFVTGDTTDFGVAALQFLGAISVRIFVLLPSLFLLGFASSRHRQLFTLQESYRHKETLAASVASFKEQAGENYESAIAAAAFEALIPDATEIDPKRQNVDQGGSGPLSRWLRRNIRDAVRDMRVMRNGED